MCPDRQILSLYHDGELPSPWKEKLETHLASCASCTVRLERYRRVSASLTAGDGDALEAARERVWEQLAARKTPSPIRTGGFWGRRVSVPLPAAAAAAAVLAAALGLALRSQPAASSPPPEALSALSIDEPAVTYPVDMDSILRYLGDADTGDMVIIRLPESKRFTSSGEPAIIRAADYSRGR